MGIMEKKIETTIWDSGVSGLGFRIYRLWEVFHEFPQQRDRASTQPTPNANAARHLTCSNCAVHLFVLWRLGLDLKVGLGNLGFRVP